MSTEPTRAHYSANWHSEISQDRAELDARSESPESPRLPAVATPEPQSPSVSGTETGTGGLNRHGDAQAGESTAPVDIVARHLHQAIETAAAQIAEEMTPVLLASSAVALQYIAAHMPGRSQDFLDGVAYAATLLGHTADDHTEGATS